jgi:hypothetical protein
MRSDGIERANKWGRISSAAALAAAACISTTSAVHAATFKSWNTGTGNWSTSANWTPAGVPGSNDIVFINVLSGGVRGVAQVTGTVTTPISVTVSNLDSLQMLGNGFSSGQLTIGGDLILADSGSVADLQVTSPQPGIIPYFGLVSVGNTIRLGREGGFGIINQNDGTVNANQLLRIGDTQQNFLFPGLGRYTLSGFGICNAARFELGWGGGTVSTAVEGEFNLSGNATLTVAAGAQAEDVVIGGGANGIGTFNQSGGTFNSPFRLIDMARGGGSAIYNFSGGTANIPGIVFSNNNGTVNYTGGANFSVGQLQMFGGGHILLSAGHDKTLRSTVVFLANAGGAIDLNDNSMVAAQFANVLGADPLQTLLTRGRDGGAWDGAGLTSTAARNDPQHITALGYGLASDVLTPDAGGVYTFHGQTVQPTDTIVKYTYYGDADLDGDADGVDIGTWATNFTGELGGTGTMSWTQGDWDYDGDVDGVDASLWAQAFTGELGGAGLGNLVVNEPNIAPGAAAILRGMGITVVPEPLGIALFAGIFGAVSIRRRLR